MKDSTRANLVIFGGLLVALVVGQISASMTREALVGWVLGPLALGLLVWVADDGAIGRLDAARKAARKADGDSKADRDSTRRKVTWEPCPRCGSARVKITGRLEACFIGLGLMCLGPVLGTLILSLFLGPFALIIGGLMAPFGLLMAITGLINPPQGECRDCKKQWSVGQEAPAAAASVASAAERG